MIKLNDLLKLSGMDLQDFKIHCTTSKNNPPLDQFFDGNFKEWQEYQNQKNFQCKHVLSLIHLSKDKWLFAGVYEILGVWQRKSKQKTWYEYSSHEVKGLNHLTGRAIIQFKKGFRASYLKGENHIENLVVSEIRGERMSVGDFPGYNSVLLSYQLLRTIVREEMPSWKSALCNVAGIYIIVDTATGKQYIGSAYGGDGIWHRWAKYAQDGHGGNKELRDLLKKKGQEHSANFQFSIFEVCDLNSSNDYVISRETHWKSVLLTREFGLNKN